MKIAYGVLGALLLVLAGCGGDDGGLPTIVPPPGTPPAISTLQFSKNTVDSMILGTIDYADPEGDLDYLTIGVVDSTGFEVYRVYIDLGAFVGQATGTLDFSIDYVLLPATVYTFTISVYDRSGNPSNPLFATFQVP